MRIIPGFFSQWKNAIGFSSSPASSKPIVFYSEGRPSAPHLGPLIRELVSRGQSIQLLMSDKDDPLASLSAPNIKKFWIGSGAARTWVYSRLEASIFVTTTPDLETMQLKRSKKDVYYVYAHHSMISSHMGYRPSAFDYFDAIFCTGPQHIDETRTHEKQQGLPAKDLVEQGYCRLDELRIVGDDSGSEVDQEGQVTVLVAPTWGENSILPICGEELIDILLESGCRVVLRPHPETTRKLPQLVNHISDRFESHPSFEIDDDPTGDVWMRRSNVMISDWSGVAMEYSYGFEKPVLFVDLPRKVNNPAYTEINIEPSEVAVRTEIGEILSATRLHQLPYAIGRLLSEESAKIEDIRRSREKRVFNLGKSASIGADFIEKILSERK
jgi:CDP-glycerol glycerophosphotransferase (TagB/SpsB family)